MRPFRVDPDLGGVGSTYTLLRGLLRFLSLLWCIHPPRTRRSEGRVTITTDVLEDRERRLVNQRRFRHHFVKCLCERGCAVCAYTGLVSKGHARRTNDSPHKVGLESLPYAQ
jgi:hypothetical protein